MRLRGRPVPPDPPLRELDARFPSHADLDGARERGALALARPVP
ncbi:MULTISPECIES: hypothetical protein [unclassified Streptomyces]|nr:MULTISPECIES: hypothetical protein [unclassified Streptomyces]